MTTKEIAIKTIQALPEDATWEDLQERINLIAPVREGIRELNNRKGIPHDKARKNLLTGFQTDMVTNNSTGPGRSSYLHC